MDSINILVTKLRETVTKNRDNHRTIYEESFQKYRDMAIAELEQMLAEAKAGKKVRRSIQLTPPMNQTKDYDRVLKMLDMTTDEIVVLSEDDFAQYVMDEWRWKEQFSQINSTYSVRASQNDDVDE
jgi:hypothetical protein